MAANRFEDSRIAEGTMRHGATEPGSDSVPRESAAISRDDVRDGFAPERAPDPETGPANLAGAAMSDLATGNLQNQPVSADSRHRRVVSARSLAGDRVHNSAGDDLGRIEEIMIDIPTGRVAYAVLSFGGFLGIGDKRFAVPWGEMRFDEGEQQFVLDVDRATLENAPGFDKSNWPDMADPSFGESIHQHYGQTPYWEHDVTDAGDYIGDNRQPNRNIEYEGTTGYRVSGRH